MDFDIMTAEGQLARWPQLRPGGTLLMIKISWLSCRAILFLKGKIEGCRH